MFSIRDVIAGPDSFEFSRNGKPVVAARRELTSRPVKLSYVRAVYGMTWTALLG